MIMNNWVVYILLCNRADKYVTYTGITKDYEKRFEEHKSGKGAKFTRSFKPICGSIVISGLTKSEALKKEIYIKKMRPADKYHLATGRMVRL